MRGLSLVLLMTTASWPGLAAVDRLTEPSITAFIAARNEATLRLDWDAVRADYLPTAQIVGLYYDRGGVPHVHNGPAAADVAVTAALMTKRGGYTVKSAISRLFVSPDGQRATATITQVTGYDAGGKHVNRVLDDTVILEWTAGQPRIAQDISVERPPE